MDQQAVTAIFQQKSGPRFEIIPAENIVERVKESLPSHSTLTVTCSPSKGIDASIETAVELAPHFAQVVPHIAARMIHSKEHLKKVFTRLKKNDINEIFVIGGDYREPIGPYAHGREVLEDLANYDHGLNHIGIPAYPEGHPNIGQTDLDDDIFQKEPYADYAVTQMCFDTKQVLTWLHDQRTAGLKLPVYLGIPGPVRLNKLLRIAPKIGVTDSLRFLKSNLKVSGKLFGGYDPSELIKSYDPYLRDEAEYNIAGLHMYTFNELSTLKKESETSAD